MRRALWIFTVIQALSCAAAQPSGTKKTTPATSERTGQKGKSELAERVPPQVRLIAELPRGSVGPYLGVSGIERLATWAEPSREGFSWYAAPLRRDADPMPLGSFPARPGIVTVRSAGPASSGAGFVVVASLESERAIVVFLLEESGRLKAKPVKLTTRGERVLWTDAVPHASGTMILWASAERGSAIVEGIETHPGGVLDEATTVIARGVLAWQTAGLPDGAALALVVDKGAGARSVEVTTINADCEVSQTPWVIREALGIELDLDMVSAEGQLLLAWTERSSGDARILRARVDPKTGSAAAPRPLVATNRDQALLSLVAPAPGHSQGYVVWEESAQSGESRRALTVARLDSNGEVGSERATLDYVGEGVPEVEFSASLRGLGALTRAPLCSASGKCGNEVAPTFVEFDEKLRAIASEPVVLDNSGRLADLVWGLSCAGDRGCRSLAAVAGESAAVFDVSLGARGSKTRFAARTPQKSADSSPAQPNPLVRADSVADFEVAGFGASRLVAWVSDFDPNQAHETPTGPAPDGKSAPVRALLDVVRVDGMRPSANPERVSWRARSLSGLDLAAGTDRALLVWSALDNGKPEVFLTLLDAAGRKLKQRMFTHQRSEVYDVAATRVDGGWIVAWVDARNGDPEVYAARITEDLNLVAPGRRLTRARGTASGLELLALGPRVLAVWSDDRSDPTRGSGNLHGVYLRSADAQPEAAERCLFEGEEHDHSPVLAADGSGVRMAWIEQRTAAKPPEAWIRTGHLDASGHFTTEPSRSQVIPGTVADLALGCTEPAGCVVAWAQAAAGRSLVFTSKVDDEGSLSDARPVGVTSGGSGRAPGLTLESGVLFFSDADPDGQRIDGLELPR